VERITERQNHLKDPKTLSATHRPESAPLETRHQTSSPRQASEETVDKLSE
jgi:hypothetical protein